MVEAPPIMDVDTVRAQFPILSRSVNGKPLVYLDNAATTQKPQAVIDTVSHFYAHENANIHRGVHYLSMNATDAYDRARATIARALNAEFEQEIIFTRGTTESINLVAHSFGARLQPGDEILITKLEHHANIVPWQILAEERGLTLRWADVTPSGEVDLDSFQSLLSEKTKLAAFNHVSNALGTINPVKEMTRLAKAAGATVLVDGAQGPPHLLVDVRDIGCDFYALSGHKVFGPDGIGVLYGRHELLETMPPYQGGGDMIERVTMEKTTFRGLPERFEAGTPNISGAIGLGAAFDYLQSLGWEEFHAHEQALLKRATERLSEIKGLTIHGTAPEKVAVVSFTMDGIHPHDIGTILDTRGVAIRAGHHCTQPLMTHFGFTGTARASFAFYNTLAEVDQLVEAIQVVHQYFS